MVDDSFNSEMINTTLLANLMHCWEADGQPVRRPMESNESKKQRIAAAESRNLRALSGWNVFQREGLGGKQLGLAEYNNAVKTLSHQWRQMTDEQKQPYEIQAVHEEHVRSRVAESGLSTKEQIETQHPMLEVSARLAEQVGKLQEQVLCKWAFQAAAMGLGGELSPRPTALEQNNGSGHGGTGGQRSGEHHDAGYPQTAVEQI